MNASAPAPSGDIPALVEPVTDPSVGQRPGSLTTVPTGPDAGPGTPTGTHTSRELLGLVTTVLRRPDLWWTALGELRRMAPKLWWRSSPHLPLPDRRLWQFRMVTAYGRPDAVPEQADVISFLEWCQATSSASRPGGHR